MLPTCSDPAPQLTRCCCCCCTCPCVTQAMGDKIKARKAAIECGVAVVPGTEGAIESADEAKAFADQVG